eukprot:1175342-Prorocentrum_minimum.AAC.2
MRTLCEALEMPGGVRRGVARAPASETRCRGRACRGVQGGIWGSSSRSLRPYLDSLPESLHSVILNAVFPRREDGSISRPVGLAAEGDSRFHGVRQTYKCLP